MREGGDLSEERGHKRVVDSTELETLEKERVREEHGREIGDRQPPRWSPELREKQVRQRDGRCRS